MNLKLIYLSSIKNKVYIYFYCDNIVVKSKINFAERLQKIIRLWYLCNI